MGSETTAWWRVLEVHNFGGFFGGDTVTLTAARWSDAQEETITIDEKVLMNVPDRHMVAPAMVFELLMVGDRVDRADLLGAADWPLLAATLAPSRPPEPLRAPRILAYRCRRCALWVLGEPVADGPVRQCRLCGEPV